MTSATAHHPFVFAPGAAASGAAADPLVDQTRREISEIVREVAAAVRSDRSAEEFLALLVDRILRAMAAEGVVVWRRSEPKQADDPIGFDAVRRIGRLTDESIPHESIGAHSRLLIEVATGGQPVVVPATPGATDCDVPANPMHVPLAVVPVESGPAAEADYLLEIFLEPQCGVATQRGYLRFVAQMADLAGEFLRGDQLRRMRRQHILGRRVDEAIAGLHEMTDRIRIEAGIVDGVAELFGFDRVGLCDVSPGRASLVSVSHVNTIDAKSSSADQIRQATTAALDADGCCFFDDDGADGDQPESLIVRTVIAAGEDDALRLVCLQTAEADPCSVECREQLVRFVRHAELAIRQASRLDAIPGGRLLASLAPRILLRGKPGRAKRLLQASFILMLLLAGFFPLPLKVNSLATLRPANVQTLSAPRDAIVDQIHVHHGQSVRLGEELLVLVDPILDEQITTLVGRRAVLVQKKSRWTNELIDTSTHRIDHSAQLQGEQSVVDEEIQSIDEQLVMLSKNKELLVIRADRDGVVDAWQLHERLDRRPLRRGDPLLKVIETGSPWLVDARVRQSRISHLQTASGQQQLHSTVSLSATPDQCWNASIVQFGPAIRSKANQNLDETAVLLRLHDDAAATIAASRDSGSQSGAPANVMFHCGTAPAAYLLFQDLIRSLRGSLSLYYSSPPKSVAATSGGNG